MRSFNPDWEAEHLRRPWGAWPCEAAVRYVMNATAPLPMPQRMAQHFLDLGCGAGAVSRFLRCEGFAVTAIDGSAAAIDRTRYMMADGGMGGPRFRADVGDVTRLPYGDGQFDIALDVACLQYLDGDQLAEALSEVARVLKPGGQFFSRCASAHGWEGIHTVGNCYPRYRSDLKAIYGEQFDELHILHELVERRNPTTSPKWPYVTVAHWNIEGRKR